ncbi:MAG: ribose 5-phosphate isomerase B [Oscillospiraceae bacterium]|jgi:ribose 5-phosphate isomerase B|nr:ribose 5-phosphate isomerase B [Oscillospiraceae bacterium]
MKIGIGNDHGAYTLKREIVALLESLGHTVIDFGVGDVTESDYPVAGKAVARAVASGECERGIVLCGTGIGISLAANKVRGIRCAVCNEPYSAQMSRLHNDANMLALGARVVGSELAKMIVRVWLETEFEGGRHARRVAQIMAIEDDAP